ncbi:MAG: radical SAM protein, partial [Eubacteriales bacterium]|nr:radical SAM protein [Eubacteriales bacterium]
SEIQEKHFFWLELGLQTAHDRTAERINRCYPYAVYENVMKELCERNIKVVTHLILGLPGETKKDMEESVHRVTKSGIWGIKLHLLNVVRGSRLAETDPDYVPFPSMEEYINLVCDLIEIIPKDIVIHRLTADAPRGTLIAPSWSYRKRSILNGINQELSRRGSIQGCRISK